MYLYHASDSLFDKLEIKGPRPGMSNNGLLGIWTSLAPQAYMKGFGKHLYQVDAPNDWREWVVPVGFIARGGAMASDKFMTEWRACLIKSYDALALTECNGRIEQIIIVNPDVIRGVERIVWP